jgi:hypothetical protein
MSQVAPFPEVLADLVVAVKYRPRWGFYLYDQYDRGQGSVGLTLIIRVVTVNSYPPHEDIVVNHLMPVPPAAYDRRSWQRWLFDQCLLVDRHEACEFFEVDGDKPFAPHHQPGADPYTVFEVGTDLERRTSFRGEINS